MCDVEPWCAICIAIRCLLGIWSRSRSRSLFLFRCPMLACYFHSTQHRYYPLSTRSRCKLRVLTPHTHSAHSTAPACLPPSDSHSHSSSLVDRVNETNQNQASPSPTVRSPSTPRSHTHHLTFPPPSSPPHTAALDPVLPRQDTGWVYRKSGSEFLHHHHLLLLLLLSPPAQPPRLRAAPFFIMASTTGAPPTETARGTGGNSPNSSPLLFFVALGFGVVFTNLWYVCVLPPSHASQHQGRGRKKERKKRKKERRERKSERKEGQGELRLPATVL